MFIFSNKVINVIPSQSKYLSLGNGQSIGSTGSDWDRKENRPYFKIPTEPTNFIPIYDSSNNDN